MDASLVAGEVKELHRFLQQWFNGAKPKTRDSFARLALAWPKGFTLIDPRNKWHDAHSILESTFDLHGCFADLSIQIKNLEVRCATSSVAVATYEEWHIDANETEARLCSATLVAGLLSSRAIQWVHIHESALASHDSPAL